MRRHTQQVLTDCDRLVPSGKHWNEQLDEENHSSHILPFLIPTYSRTQCHRGLLEPHPAISKCSLWLRFSLFFMQCILIFWYYEFATFLTCKTWSAKSKERTWNALICILLIWQIDILSLLAEIKHPLAYSKFPSICLYRQRSTVLFKKMYAAIFEESSRLVTLHSTQDDSASSLCTRGWWLLVLSLHFSRCATHNPTVVRWCSRRKCLQWRAKLWSWDLVILLQVPRVCPDVTVAVGRTSLKVRHRCF